MRYKKKVLPNGMRVISVPKKEHKAVTVLVLVEAGSKYETKDMNGVSHFLEHMCFKGTEKRPHAIDISHELDSIGSRSNAFTGHEYTGYYIKAHKKHLSRMVDILSDIYINPKFRDDEIEREKGVIADEINMYEDMPQQKVQENMMKLLYGDQPAGWPIAGNKATIRKFGREDFINYRAKHYLSGSTVVVVSGEYDEKKLFDLVKKKFAGIPEGKQQRKKKVIEAQKRPKVTLEYRKSDQTHLVLGVRTYNMFHKDNPTLSIISALLGGGMSSRLFQKIREEMGVGYYVHASNNKLTDHGFLEAAVGADNKRAKEVVSALIAEFKRLTEEPVTDRELQKVKDYLVGNLFLGLEASDDIAEFYGFQEIFHKPIISPVELAKRINAVSVADVRRVARKVFTNDRLNLSVVGPFRDKKGFGKLLKF